MSNYQENVRYLLGNNVEAHINAYSGALTVPKLEMVTAAHLAFHLVMKVEEVHGTRKEYEGYTWEDALYGIRRNIEWRLQNGMSINRVFGEHRPVGRNIAVRVDGYPRSGNEAVLKADNRNYFEDHPTAENRALIQKGFFEVLDEVVLPFEDPELEELLKLGNA